MDKNDGQFPFLLVSVRVRQGSKGTGVGKIVPTRGDFEYTFGLSFCTQSLLSELVSSRSLRVLPSTRRPHLSQVRFHLLPEVLSTVVLFFYLDSLMVHTSLCNSFRNVQPLRKPLRVPLGSIIFLHFVN